MACIKMNVDTMLSLPANFETIQFIETAQLQRTCIIFLRAIFTLIISMFAIRKWYNIAMRNSFGSLFSMLCYSLRRPQCCTNSFTSHFEGLAQYARMVSLSQSFIPRLLNSAYILLNNGSHFGRRDFCQAFIPGRMMIANEFIPMSFRMTYRQIASTRTQWCCLSLYYNWIKICFMSLFPMLSKPYPMAQAIVSPSFALLPGNWLFTTTGTIWRLATYCSKSILPSFLNLYDTFWQMLGTRLRAASFSFRWQSHPLVAACQASFNVSRPFRSSCYHHNYFTLIRDYLSNA